MDLDTVELDAQSADGVSDFSVGDEDEEIRIESPASVIEVEDIEALLTDVQDQVFGEMRLPPLFVQSVQSGWQTFLDGQTSRDAAGEAIYAAIFDAAPELQHLFKTARSVMAMKFMNGLNIMISELAQPTALKDAAETLAFQHLEIDVTTPRAGVFRQAILDLMEMELGQRFSSEARHGLTALLNYLAGAMIYVRREYSERISLLRVSWIAASTSRVGQEEEGLPEPSTESMEKFREREEGNQEANKMGRGTAKKIQATKVPENFGEMFLFNAAVMGFHMGINWMSFVLDQFENMVLNASNTTRLQEECDVLSLRLVKIKDPIVFSEFKAVMLASLRSLIPKVWGIDHEVAWTWFWDNLERMLKTQITNLKGQQRAVERFIRSLSDESIPILCKDVYRRFFEQAPTGQNYFKQSVTRLFFIASKVMEMCMEIYQRPRELMEDISALGLRHVGYAVPTELFMPFVEAWSQAIQQLNVEPKTSSSIRWALTLISKCLMRTILEGSTLVMKAINTNSASKFRKAIAVTSRKKREQELLKVTVGTQSISPLYWAMKSGSFNVARAMLVDLLMIRADRDNYYYGCDALFERHPDIVKECCAVRGQGLLPALFDGLLWRSRVAVKNMRRVNFFVEHLIQNKDGTFNTYLPVIVKLNDPKIIGHPVVSFVFNLLWTRLARYYFLRSRLLSLFLVLLTVFSQSILPRINVRAEPAWQRILLFVCRLVLYLVDLAPHVLEHILLVVKDIRARAFLYLGGVLPVPAYLHSVPRASQLLMIICMIFMCIYEPIFACIGNMDGDFAGKGLFTTRCPAAEARMDTYSVFAQLTVALHWFLLTDLCILSLRLCCYFLTCSQVLVEVLHYIIAILFLVLAFACAIGAFDTVLVDFENVPSGAWSLLKIVLRMYESDNFEEVRGVPQIYTLLVTFTVIALVFLGSLLVAQITGTYIKILDDVANFGVLFRSGITVQTVRSTRPKTWASFLASLRFQERIEFNEGDVGLKGGIQVLEAANLNPTLEERIRRFGGSTSVENPWPEDELMDLGSMEGRLKRLEKLVIRATKAMSGGSKASGDGSRSENSSGSVFLSSGASGNSGGS